MLIKVAIVDDHPLVINGLQNVLRNVEHIEVIATYSSGDALLEGLTKEQPDVLLLDIQLPGKSGIEIAGIINKNYPNIRVLALTSVESLSQVKAMMLHNCRGYLLKSNTDQAALVNAIDQVYNNEMAIEPALKDQLLQRMFKIKEPTDKSNPKLTRREKEILQLVVDEYTNQEIADKLFLSLHTIENHRFSLLKKLNVKNTAGLVKLALQMGLVE